MDAVRFAVQRKICSAVISTVEDCESCDGIWTIASPAARRIIATTQNSQWPGSIFLINCLARLIWISCGKRVAALLRLTNRYAQRSQSIIVRRCNGKKATQIIKW